MNLDVHKTVLENKETETGCTLHLVTEEVDGGAILMQKSTQIVGMIKHILNNHAYQYAEGDTPETLRDRVQKLEQDCFLECIQNVIDGKLKLPYE